MQLLQVKDKSDYSMTNPLNPTPQCSKTHTGVEEREKDRDVMDALKGGDTILREEEVRRRKAISDQGDNMDEAWNQETQSV